MAEEEEGSWNAFGKEALAANQIKLMYRATNEQCHRMVTYI